MRIRIEIPWEFQIFNFSLVIIVKDNRSYPVLNKDISDFDQNFVVRGLFNNKNWEQLL